MQVILTDDVSGLGDIGQSVKVKPGYARNFLIPRGLAVEVGSRSARAEAHKMRQIDAKKRRMKGAADEVASRVRNAELKFELRVGSGGKVFGSVGAKDIAEGLVAAKIEIDRRRVVLAEPLKKIGVHFVEVKLHPEVSAQVKVVVTSLEASADEEKQETAEARARFEEVDYDLDDDTEE